MVPHQGLDARQIQPNLSFGQVELTTWLSSFKYQYTRKFLYQPRKWLFRKPDRKISVDPCNKNISFEHGLRCVFEDLTDEKSTFDQVMTWCCQAYCWPWSLIKHMSSSGHNELKRSFWLDTALETLTIWAMALWSDLQRVNLSPQILNLSTSIIVPFLDSTWL